MDNTSLIAEAKKAIKAVFSNTSVGRAQTRDDLSDIQDEITQLVATLDEDDPAGE